MESIEEILHLKFYDCNELDDDTGSSASSTLGDLVGIPKTSPFNMSKMSDALGVAEKKMKKRRKRTIGAARRKKQLEMIHDMNRLEKLLHEAIKKSDEEKVRTACAMAREVRNRVFAEYDRSNRNVSRLDVD